MKSDLLPKSFLKKIRIDKISKEKKKYPKISIVIPSYNSAEFIEDCIISIINQKYPNTEIIIIDAGSKDGTIEIIKKYKKFITYWVSEKDKNQSDALNKGFQKCSGEVYGWLNADDVYLPYTFLKVVKTLRDNQTKSIFHGDWLEIDEKNNILTKNYTFKYSLNQFLNEGYCLHPQSLFWKRDVHLRFGKFHTGLKTNMEKQMIILFSKNEGEEKFQVIPNFLAAWRRHKFQITANFEKRSIDDNNLLYKHLMIKKPNFILSKFLWLIFRLRRIWWYFKRAGYLYVILKFKENIYRIFL